MTYMPPAPTPDTIRGLRKAGWSQRELKGFLSSWGLDPDVYAPAEAAAAPAVVPPPPAAGQPAAPPAPVAATVDTRVPVAKDASLPPPPNEQAGAMQEAGYSPEAIKAFQANQGGAATSSVTAEQVQGTGAGKAGLGSIPPPPEEGGGFLGEQPEENYPIQPPAGPAGAQPPPPPSGVTAQPQPSSLGPLNIGPGGIGQPGAPPQEPTEELPPSPEETQAEIARRQGTPGTPPPVPPGQAGTQPGAAVEPKPSGYSAGPKDTPWDTKTALNYLVDRGLLKPGEEQDPEKVKKAIIAAANVASREFGAGGKGWMGTQKMFAALQAAKPEEIAGILTKQAGTTGPLPTSLYEKYFGADWPSFKDMTPEQLDSLIEPTGITQAVKAGTLDAQTGASLLERWLAGNPDKAAALGPDYFDPTKNTDLRGPLMLLKATGVLPKYITATTAGAVQPASPEVIKSYRDSIRMGRAPVDMTPAAIKVFANTPPARPSWLIEESSGVWIDPAVGEGVPPTGESLVALNEYLDAKEWYEKYTLPLATAYGKTLVEIDADAKKADSLRAQTAKEQADGNYYGAAEHAEELRKLEQKKVAQDMGLELSKFLMDLTKSPAQLRRMQASGVLDDIQRALGLDAPIIIPDKAPQSKVMELLPALGDLRSLPPEQLYEHLSNIAAMTGWEPEELVMLVQGMATAPGSMARGGAGGGAGTQARTVRAQR